MMVRLLSLSLCPTIQRGWSRASPLVSTLYRGMRFPLFDIARVVYGGTSDPHRPRSCSPRSDLDRLLLIHRTDLSPHRSLPRPLSLINPDVDANLQGDPLDPQLSADVITPENAYAQPQALPAFTTAVEYARPISIMEDCANGPHVLKNTVNPEAHARALCVNDSAGRLPSPVPQQTNDTKGGGWLRGSGAVKKPRRLSATFPPCPNDDMWCVVHFLAVVSFLCGCPSVALKPTLSSAAEPTAACSAAGPPH
jgi:hypothetical protein